MRFWDSSVVVPLVVLESTSDQVQAWYRQDVSMVVWCLTATEVVSALQRRHREGALDVAVLETALHRLRLLREDWLEVYSIRLVRERAERLLSTHPLKAADALQLAAALIATEDRPRGLTFLTFDRHLETAARKEGFSLS